MDSEWYIDPLDIDQIYQQFNTDARRAGYNLNPDAAFTRELVEGLIVNGNRYGYYACPCRLAAGNREADRDIICPCDYRDDDLSEYGACYCGLYVSSEVLKKEKKLSPVPERRPPENERKSSAKTADRLPSFKLSHPVWRCMVCGYLCAREEPPEVCPICKAEKDRFELFMHGGNQAE